MSVRSALVVDDDADVRRLCEVSLRAFAAWTVLLADSAETALEAAARHAPDVILLDVMMPGAGGAQALALLRRDARTARIPVVMMTAAPGDGATWRALGAAGVIAKPFDPTTLADRIGRLVSPGVVA